MPIQVPDARRVARRALILSAVVCRSFSDSAPDDPDAQALWMRLCNWIDAIDVASEIEQRERDLIFAPLGTLPESTAIQGQWYCEGLAILAWALELFPYPEHDRQVNPYEVTDALQFLSADAGSLINSLRLRSPNELSACRELLYSIHCRLRQFNREKKAADIRHWIDSQWLETLGTVSVLDTSGDLRIGETDLSQAVEVEWRQCESVIYERHRAIIWLVGDSEPVYSQVAVDT